MYCTNVLQRAHREDKRHATLLAYLPFSSEIRDCKQADTRVIVNCCGHVMQDVLSGLRQQIVVQLLV